MVPKSRITTQSYEICPVTASDQSSTQHGSNHRFTDDYVSDNDDWKDVSARAAHKSVATTIEEVNEQRLNPPLGIPTSKKRLDGIDLFASGLCFICLVAAITVVASDRVSWYLGRNNYQLVVLGFLLSVMNLCLTSIAPTVFLLLEAKFGPSTLQNYEGILRNQMFTSHMSVLWRLVLGSMLLLPIGLSVIYKLFSGGRSTLVVDAVSYTANSSYYGMFSLPGLHNMGLNSGLTLFANATLSFFAASQFHDGEPPLPDRELAYGFNHLILNGNSAAMLDIPQPEYISAVQYALSPGEYWNITASVTGTVATFNTSNATDSEEYLQRSLETCWAAQNGSGVYKWIAIYENPSINFVHVSGPDPGNNSVQWIGFDFGPNNGTVAPYLSCEAFVPNSYMFGITRQPCNATWSISRSAVKLLEGSCSELLLPPREQDIMTNSSLGLGDMYVQSLAEIVSPFARYRVGSEWMLPSMASGIAAMLWSRLTAQYSAASKVEDSWWVQQNRTTQDLGMIYQVQDQVLYVRPTLRKSALLYSALALQPLLCFVVVVVKWSFYTTPVERGFGLISVLAGLNTENLRDLRGAALSGELMRSVKLYISPEHDARGVSIRYNIVVDTEPFSNGRLRKATEYR